MGKFGNISKQNKSKLKEDLDNYSIFLKNLYQFSNVIPLKKFIYYNY